MWIKNVLLETGYTSENEVVVATETKLASIKVEDGIITEIDADNQATDGIDAQGYLALPSFREMHVHLDKGHYGGPWKAAIPMGGVFDRIKEEEGFLVSFLENTPERAQALVDLITSFGVTHMRVQVNVDPVIGLQNARIVKEVLDNNTDKLTYELVAFPQHGTLRTHAENLLEQALEEGQDLLLGGLDPANVDKDIEKSLTVTFDLAKKHNRPIDFHLHTGGTLGVYEIERILDYIEKYEMQGKVSLSHTFSLGDIPRAKVIELAKRFKALGVDINTTQPLGRPALPFMDFINEGVIVSMANDCINDHWQSFNSGDVIERIYLGSQLHGLDGEYHLSRALQAVTGGLTPLDDEGNQVWPKVGDKADIVFVKAESTAHLVARRIPERVTMFKGNIVHGEFN